MVGLCFVLVVAAIATVQAANRPAVVPIHRQPYRVRVSVSFGESPSLTAAFRRSVLRRLEQAARRTVGSIWTLRAEENRRSFPASEAGLEHAPLANAGSPRDASRFDKVYVLGIVAAGPEFRIFGHEWDAKSRQSGPRQSTRASQRRDVPSVMLSLIRRLFRPIAEVEDVKDKTVLLRLQAGVFPPIDPAAAQLQPGDLLTPFFRYLDRKRVVRKIQFLSWTYLRVENIDGERITCKLISGLRSPLGTKRRRVELFAIGVRPTVPATRLDLSTRAKAPKPLIGVHVTVADKKLSKTEKPSRPPLVLTTDRRGSVVIPVDARQSLVWLYVHSGRALLARVPFVPGLEPNASIQLPDDALRLFVEGQVSLLKGELIDTVARRATLVARARLLSKRGDKKGVLALAAELDKLPDLEQFEAKLTTIRVPAIQQAQATRNRLTERRIKRLCDDALVSIRRWLDPDRLRQAKDEISDLARDAVKK